LLLRSGLRRAGIYRRRMLRNRLGGFGQGGFPSLPLARWHWQARHSPGPPRPRTALRLPAHHCFRLRYGSVPPAQPGSVSATEHNAGNYAQRKTALSASPHNLHYV